jgi:hypothetical protein
VRKRNGASTGLLELELPYGGERQVRDEELAWRRYTEVVMKGGYTSLRTSAVVALGRAENPILRDTDARWTGALGYRKSWGTWWGLATLGLGGAGYRGIELDITERRISAGVSGGYRWLEWAIVPHLGLSFELTGIEQRVTRDREQEIRETFGVGAVPPRRALALGVGVVAGVEIPIEDALFALVQGQALLTAVPLAEDASSSMQPVALVSAGLGWRF